MNKNKAIFVIGYPGSGKDIVIRDICSNYNIVEFTAAKLFDMLTNNTCFKNSNVQKQTALLEHNSLLVTANAFNMEFNTIKQILENIGYSSHLIFVETAFPIAIERLKDRNDLKESIEKIKIAIENKNSIFSLFESSICIENNATLDLSESRLFVNYLLNTFSFNTTITLESIINTPKKTKKTKFVVPKQVQGDTYDTRGGQQTDWSSHIEESIDEPSYLITPTATGSVQAINTIVPDQRPDQDKNRTKNLLSKIKKIKTDKLFIPKDIY